MKTIFYVILIIVVAILAWTFTPVYAETYSVDPREIRPAEHRWVFTPDEVKAILIDYLAKKGTRIPKGKSVIYGISGPDCGASQPKITIKIKEIVE